LFTYIGGIRFFFGPIVGAILGVFMSVFLSEWTAAWQLYMGILFIFIVVQAPQGLTGLVIDFLKLFQRARGQATLLIFGWHCCLNFVLATLFSIGMILIIEMLYRLRFHSGDEQIMHLFSIELNPHHLLVWSIAALMIGTSVLINGLLRTKRGDHL
jgi:branched-chain amino acid transport system permease protein